MPHPFDCIPSMAIMKFIQPKQRFFICTLSKSIRSLWISHVLSHTKPWEFPFWASQTMTPEFKAHLRHLRCDLEIVPLQMEYPKVTYLACEIWNPSFRLWTSVTSLEVGGSVIIEDLPPNLINLSFTEAVEIRGNKWPTKLSTIHFNCGVLNHFLWPISLTEITLTRGGYCDFNLRLTDAPNVTSLNLVDMHVFRIRNLPLNLTTMSCVGDLIIGGSDWPPNMHTLHFKSKFKFSDDFQWPQKLKRLTIDHFKSISIPILPCSLEVLRIPAWNNITKILQMNLPNLQHLEASSCDVSDDQTHPFRLCPNLTVLSLKSLSCSVWPSKLKTLILGGKIVSIN